MGVKNLDFSSLKKSKFQNLVLCTFFLCNLIKVINKFVAIVILSDQN